MTFPWLFHDQLKFSMTQKCWKPSLLGAYFFSVTRKIFPVFKQHEIFGPKKWNSMTFPWPRLFSLKSMTFPGLENAFSNSMTFHDFSWPYEPCFIIYKPSIFQTLKANIINKYCKHDNKRSCTVHWKTKIKKSFDIHDTYICRQIYMYACVWLLVWMLILKFYDLINSKQKNIHSLITFLLYGWLISCSVIGQFYVCK